MLVYYRTWHLDDESLKPTDNLFKILVKFRIIDVRAMYGMDHATYSISGIKKP